MRCYDDSDAVVRRLLYDPGIDKEFRIQFIGVECILTIDRLHYETTKPMNSHEEVGPKINN